MGLTEGQAREQYGDAVECYRKEFLPLRYTLTKHQQKALIKLVVDGNSDRILGIHMAGENAAEIVQRTQCDRVMSITLVVETLLML